MLISIVVPLYNADKYIGETINSVLKQTYSNWELIIVDDCSTDNSRQVVEEFMADQRIKLIKLDNNFGGPAGPRNIGIEKAKGEYVSFLDADDLWDENKLYHQLNFMRTESLDFSSTEVYPFEIVGNKMRPIKFSRFHGLIKKHN